ncbi:MAG: UbiA family prenyltransferase, partial [Caldilineaceae bacterium]|nr:UbiA family prenyltransferase [Caldilineaceae bacterium]
SIALLVLGAAVGRLTWIGLAAFPQWPAKRIPRHWRRARILAMAAGASLYVALFFGSVVVTADGLAECTVWPLCVPSGEGAVFAIAHRLIAGASTLLIIMLAMWALRNYESRGLKQAARWAIGLIVAQNIVGLLMVLAAHGDVAFPLSYARLAHLAVGAITWSGIVVLAVITLRVPPFITERTTATQEVQTKTKAERQPSLWQDYISLTKPRVITLLIFTTFVALFITPAGVPSLSIILWTMIGGWLMPAGAQSINCYFDGDIDAKMGRTSRRPIPSGRIPGWHALALGIALGALAFAILAYFVNPLTAWVAFAGYLYYAVIYTIVLKRHSVHNIVIGGGAGAIPPLVGWAAA